MDAAVITPAKRSRSTALAVRADVALTFEQLFEAASIDSVASLLVEYKAERTRVERIAALFTDKGELGAVEHFLDAARDRHSGYTSSVAGLFELGPAVGVLNAHYWSRVLDTTDVYAAMPQPRRDAWNESIRKRETPDFEDATVVATLQRLLADRKSFFAEKVDGIFRALSGEHVTNSPLGFGKRMILQSVYDGLCSHSRCGTISDLREVVAKFMGREVPNWLGTSEVVKYAREYCCGEWVQMDGGAIRIRVYQNGNGHLEVHPEMAWRLNCVLASIYPHAIASEHRARPRKLPKDWPLFGRPLPFAVLGLLQGGNVDAPCSLDEARRRLREVARYDDLKITPERVASRAHEGRWRFTFSHSTDKGPARDEACRVLESLGATRTRAGSDVYDFTYDPRAVLREVAASGCLPDQQAHQYYPTPPDLAARVVELAEVGPDHRVLEPSAGQGALADLLRVGHALCVEVSELHAAILRAKGHRVVCADFLRWAGGLFDRVPMNPPFSEGRWQAHLERAAGMVAPGGRLVAVLPASAVGRQLEGFRCRWEPPVDFPGTSIQVAVLVADREEARYA
jgi:hypothetical protein